jgi:hypothetical protein
MPTPVHCPPDQPRRTAPGRLPVLRKRVDPRRRPPGEVDQVRILVAVADPGDRADSSGRPQERRRRLRNPADPLRRQVHRIPPALRLPLGDAQLCELVLLVWWAGYHPGLMSYDSIDYSWEVTTGHWVDDHSIAYDGAVWLTLVLTGGYGPLTLVQTVAMAAVIGYLAAGLRKLRVPTGWIVAGALLAAILPTTGAFMVWVWKDVPYVIGSALAMSALVHLAAELLRAPAPARRAGDRRDWLLLGAGLTLMCLARNDGFLAVLIAGVALLVILRRQWRRVLAVTLLPVALFFLLDRAVYPALGVTRPVNYAGNTFFYADTAYAYSKAPATFTSADLAVMAKVSPLAHWAAAGARCTTTDALTDPQFDLARAAALNRQLVGVFVRVAQRTPQLVAEATLCRGHMAWAVFPGSDPVNPPGTGWDSNLYGFADVVPGVYTNPYYHVMRPQPFSDHLRGVVNWWYRLLSTAQIVWLLWGGAVWCWIAYLLIIRLARRRVRRELLAIGAITLGLQLDVLIAIPSSLYRYMAGPTMIGVLLLPLALSRLGAPTVPAPVFTLPADPGPVGRAGGAGAATGVATAAAEKPSTA